MNEFNFQTERFEASVAVLKGESKYFIEGYVSRTSPDLHEDVVTIEGQKDLISQLVGRQVTLDVEHDDWFPEEGGVRNPANAGKQLPTPRSTIPVAKVVAAELRADGAWAKVELNQHSPRFKSVWGSIKEGFLHSFSVAFFPVKALTKAMNGVTRTFIDALNIVNITLTGSPVHPGATFQPVLKAALKALQEETPMEEKKVEAPVAAAPAAPVVDNKVEEQLKVVEAEKVKLTQEKEALVAEKTKLEQELKTVNERVTQTAQAAQAAQAVTQQFIGPLSSLKAMQDEISDYKSQIAKLKAELNVPVMKARQDAAPQDIDVKVALVGPVDRIQ